MSLQDFKKFVENLVEDGYLDEGEERDAMIHAAGLGLKSNDALATLREVCFDKNAKLESHESSLYVEEIQSFIDDGFLDLGEEEDLIQLGIEHFDGADDPHGKASQVLTMILSKNRCLTESDFRQQIEKRLQPIVYSGGKISPSEWQVHKDTLTQYAINKNADPEENDLEEILDSVLQDMGISVEVPSSGSSPNAGLLIGGVLVLLGVGWFMTQSNTNETSPTGEVAQNSKIAVKSSNNAVDSLPNCSTVSTELKQANLAWHKAAKTASYCTAEKNSSNTVFTAGQIVRTLCQPFEELSVRSKNKAMDSYSCWEYCELDSKEVNRIQEFYLQQSSKSSSGISSCEWMRRCLAVVSGNEACSAQSKTLGCKHKPSDFTRCE